MAYVRQYGNGRWQAVVRRKGSPPLSQTFQTHENALKWARGIEGRIDVSLGTQGLSYQRITLAEAFDRYLEEVTPRKRSARREAQRIKLLRQAFGHYTFQTLGRREIATFRDKRLAAGCAGATVVKDLNTLSHVFEVARRDWGYALPENPAKLVRRPAVARGRDRRLSASEYDRLKLACAESKAPLLPHIVDLAIETGMRLGEMLSLTWPNVDTKRRVTRLDMTKNGDARIVPLSTRAVITLSTLPRHIADNRVFWAWKRPDAFENAWRRAVTRAGITDLRFHDLRHEAASRLFELGLNPMEVAAITGHKTLQMLKRYTHLKAEDLARRLG
jgi:integrase